MYVHVIIYDYIFFRYVSWVYLKIKYLIVRSLFRDKILIVNIIFYWMGLGFFGGNVWFESRGLKCVNVLESIIVFKVK